MPTQLTFFTGSSVMEITSSMKQLLSASPGPLSGVTLLGPLSGADDPEYSTEQKSHHTDMEIFCGYLEVTPTPIHPPFKILQRNVCMEYSISPNLHKCMKVYLM